MCVCVCVCVGVWVCVCVSVLIPEWVETVFRVVVVGLGDGGVALKAILKIAILSITYVSNVP